MDIETYKQSLREPHCDFIFQIIRLTTLFGIGSCAFLLKPFCPSVEDLEAGSSSSLNSVKTMTRNRQSRKAGAMDSWHSPRTFG